jgi:archaellin
VKNSDRTQLASSGSGSARILYAPSGTGTKWCVVRINDPSGGDPVRLGKTTATWTKGTTATIDVWESGTPPSETQTSGVTIANCVNKFATVASGKWVMVAKAGNGSWYLIAAEC